MLQTERSLSKILVQRLAKSQKRFNRCLDLASEVIIFGSMAVGLESENSDIDCFAVGDFRDQLKTDDVDLIIFPRLTIESQRWLRSELASHIAKYGVWLKGSPRWRSEVKIGTLAVTEKRRRVAAFMQYLPAAWFKLEECFRVQYSVKLRREIQRLALLEENVPVPPTKILDCSWSDFAGPQNIRDRAKKFAEGCSPAFTKDLLSRIDLQLGA